MSKTPKSKNNAFVHTTPAAIIAEAEARGFAKAVAKIVLALREDDRKFAADFVIKQFGAGVEARVEKSLLLLESIDDMLAQAKPQMLQKFSPEDTEQILLTSRKMVENALSVRAPTVDIAMYAVALSANMLDTYSESVAMALGDRE